MRWLAALALVGVAAGCGARLPESAVEDAAAETAAARSSRWSFEIAFDGGRISGGGVADYARDRGAFTYAVAAERDGEGISPVDGTFEIRFLGDTVYMKWPPHRVASRFRLPAGKQWTSFTADDEEPSLSDLVFDPLREPGELLDTLRRASTGVADVGRASVRGVETTHYELSIDLERVVEQAPAAAREELRRDLVERERKTMRAEVWVDDDGLARRIRIVDEEFDDGAVTTEFFDFGIEVDVQPPPTDEVATADEWEQAIEQAARDEDVRIPVGDDPELKNADENGDGHVTIAELSAADLGGSGMTSYVVEGDFPIDIDDAPHLKKADANGDGKVSEHEFQAFVDDEDDGD